MGSNPAPSTPPGNLLGVYILEPHPDLQNQKLWGRPPVASQVILAPWLPARAAQEHQPDAHLKSLVLGPLTEQFNQALWGELGESRERGCFSKLPL